MVAARSNTLALDIGGTGLKATVLDPTGRMLTDRARVDTTYPMPPDRLVATLATLVAPLPRFERIAIGLPGVVRDRRVLTAPHFITRAGPGTPIDPALRTAWTGFDLAAAIEHTLGQPTRILNDADLQGLDVVVGNGVEIVMTLGTGVGSAVFENEELRQAHPGKSAERYQRSGRCSRNRTHPALGTSTRAHLRDRCSMDTSRITNPSSRPARRHVGCPKWAGFFHQFLKPWRRSRKAPCCTADDPAASHGDAWRASAS